MAHGDAQEGKWKGNSRMEWVASTLHTTSEHGVSSITTADAHTSAASGRLNWRPPADLNGLVRFAEGRNLVSARVPSYFNWPVLRFLMSFLPQTSMLFQKGFSKHWYLGLLAYTWRLNPTINSEVCLPRYVSKDYWWGKYQSWKYNCGSIDLWFCLIAKNNCMFRPIAVIFRLLQFLLKEYHRVSFCSKSKIAITWRGPLLAETCSYFFAIKHHHKSILPYFHCYTVHVVQLLNYYTNHCTYIKFITFYGLKH
jgi:hypothetical protein